MKTLLVALLFCYVVVEIYSLASFEDLTAVKLTEFKRQWKEAEQSNTKLTAELARFFHEGESGEYEDAGSSWSKVEPGPYELNAVKDVVDALRDKLIPAVAKTTKRRDEKSEEYAGELVKMLKGDASRKELKQALGKAVMEMHQKCDETQKYFLKLANMSGLVGVLRQAMGPEEDLDAVKLMKKVDDAGEEGEAFEALQKLFELAQGSKVNPALKSFLMVNKLLAHASCGNPTEGLVEVIDKRAQEEDSDSEPFPDLKDKIFPFLGLGNESPKQCKKRKGLIDKNDDTPDSLKKKMMTLVLQAEKKKLCKDVPAVLRYLDITLQVIKLSKKVGVLMMVEHKQQIVLIEKIKSLMEHGRYGLAARLVGAAVLDSLRKDMTIGLIVKEKLGMRKPSPSLPIKPSKPRDLSAQEQRVERA